MVDASTDPWAYQGLFSSAPVGDELHVVVLVAGEVVDTFAYVSTDPNAKLDNGSTNYVVDVVTAGSSWVDLSGIPTAGQYPLQNGDDGTTPEYVAAYTNVFGDKDTIQIDFLVPPAGGQSSMLLQFNRNW